MVERARLGEGKERLAEVGCVAPGGVGLSSGAEGRRVGRGKALDQRESMQDVIPLQNQKLP